jgi:hypothetical protein
MEGRAVPFSSVEVFQKPLYSPYGMLSGIFQTPEMEEVLGWGTGSPSSEQDTLVNLYFSDLSI